MEIWGQQYTCTTRVFHPYKKNPRFDSGLFQNYFIDEKRQKKLLDCMVNFESEILWGKKVYFQDCTKNDEIIRVDLKRQLNDVDYGSVSYAHLINKRQLR